MTPSMDAGVLTGTVFAAADATLRNSQHYELFRSGRSARADYHRLIESRATDLRSAGVPASDLPFLKRFPRRPWAGAEAILADLHRRDLLKASAYDVAALQHTAHMMADFVHGPFKTYIYPEEAILLGALAQICSPRRALFLGSYYGYWAHWAIPGIVAGGGRATLVDPDGQCCEIARHNLRNNGFADAVDVVAATGECFLATTDERFDLVVLDAETPRDHPDPELRGKRVYRSLMQACLPRLTQGAMLVCHNILFADDTGDPAFAGIIGRNRDELGAFAALAGRSFYPFVEYRTTEGVGIGRLSGTPGSGQWPIVAEIDLDADWPS
ncbi:MAG TPA: class I SAM-dependent methyltransferase [Reyranella sp.]|jgi:predicted O-methyltransferase YrrM|nr:class I SAM-dependent methyltransferase [Reyranella sp.]